MLVICGVIIAAVVLVFLNPLLHLFGVTTKILPYAQDYTGITAFGIPFLILTTGGHLLKMILSLGMASCINQIAMAVVQIMRQDISGFLCL